MVQHADIDHTGITGVGGTPASTLITDTVLAIATASFDFTSIPGTYKHLQLFLSGRSDRAANVEEHVRLRFNNDSGSNYDWTMNPLYEAVSTTTGWDEAFGGTGVDRMLSIAAATATASRASSGIIWVPDYAGTTFHKTVMASGVHAFGTSTGNIRSIMASGDWRSTAAITRITLTCLNGSNFIAGSRCSLYGIG